MLHDTSIHDLYEKGRKNKVLSLYIDTDPATGVWKNKRSSIKHALEELETGLPVNERPLFAPEREKAMAFIQKYEPHNRGLAIFSSAPQNLWQVEDFSLRMENDFRFGTGAYLLPLVTLQNRHAPFAVVLVDNEQARLFAVALTDVEGKAVVHDYVPGRHKQTEHAARVEYRHAKKVEDHLRHTLTALEEMRKQHGFRRIIIGGSEDTLPKFRELLPSVMAGLVIGRIANDIRESDEKILADALIIAEKHREGQEAAISERLITRTSKHDHALLGADDTLLALRERRIHELVLAHDAAISGSRCTTCGMASKTITRACHICGNLMVRDDALAEHAVKLAAGAQAKITMLFGPAKEKLAAVDGIGGFIAAKG